MPRTKALTARANFIQNSSQTAVDYILEGKHPNLFVNEDTGLLSTNGALTRP